MTSQAIDSKLQVLVDADACPVKAEVLTVAERLNVPVIFVANSGLRPSRNPMVRMVVVPKGFDAADDWIVENAAHGDVVVTADIPLAGRCVEKGAFVVGPTGKLFTPGNIGVVSAMRDLNQHLRESGEIKGYNAAFSSRDRSQFLSALDQTIRRALRIRADN